MVKNATVCAQSSTKTSEPTDATVTSTIIDAIDAALGNGDDGERDDE